MKAFLLILFSFGLANAQQNPQIRACNIAGGHFYTLDVEEPQPDNIGFCNFNGSLLGSISVLRMIDGQMPMATKAFMNTKNQAVSSCPRAGGKLIHGIKEDTLYFLCLFDDNSHISEISLIEGWNSSFNSGLRAFIETWTVK